MSTTTRTHMDRKLTKATMDDGSMDLDKIFVEMEDKL